MSRLPDQLSDLEAVRLCRAGDEAGFRALLQAHQVYVFRTCWRLVGSREEALDLTQEVFLRVVVALPRLEPRPSLRPWLRRVSYNLCLNALQRRRNDPLRGEGDLAPAASGAERGDPEFALGAGATDPVAETVLARFSLAEVGARLRRLRPVERAVVLLKTVEDLSYEEIGGLLDLPLGTVKSHLSRARQSLRAAAATEGRS